MKTLLIYYSRTGITRKVAEFIQSQSNCDSEEIISIKKRAGVIGFMLSGREGLKKELAEIENTKSNVTEYDLVIIGTPIWAGNISSPVRTYLTQNAGKFKKLAAFCTMGGDDPEKSFSEIEKVSNAKLFSKASFSTKDVKADDFKEKAKKFVAQILQ